MKKLYGQAGKSLLEVLASVVIISFMFTLISSYFISSVNHSVLTSKHFTTTQIAEALLNVYKKKGFEFLEPHIGGPAIQIDTAADIKNELGLGSLSFEPNLDFIKAEYTVEDSSISDDILFINVTVEANVNGKEINTTLGGYVRNE